MSKEGQEQNKEPAEPVETAEDFESEAVREGWVPRDDYRGDPKHWVDAETFVKRGREINAILRSKNQRQEAENAALRRELDELKVAQQEFAVHHKKAVEAEFQRAMAELREQKKTAMREDDDDAVIDIDEKIAELRAEHKSQQTQAPAPQQTNPEDSPAFRAWRMENGWYDTDPALRDEAEFIGHQVTRDRAGGNSEKEFLDEVARRLRARHPDRFNNPRRDGPGRFEGGAGSTSSRAAGGRKRGYNDLPSDAQKACDDFVKRGWMTREQYLAEYQWES